MAVLEAVDIGLCVEVGATVFVAVLVAGSAVCVRVNVRVRLGDGVLVVVLDCVPVAVDVADGTTVAVGVEDGTTVGVRDAVTVPIEVAVRVAVASMVAVRVEVRLGDAVCVIVGVDVATGAKTATISWANSPTCSREALLGPQIICNAVSAKNI